MQNGGEYNDVGHYHMHIFPRYAGDGFGWTYGSDGENWCKPVKIRYCRMNEVSDKYKGTIETTMSYKEMKDKYGKDEVKE